MSPKYNPVRLLALTVTVLTAFIGAAAAPIYDGRPLVPVVVLAWCAVAIAVLTAVGGELARGLVTPLAAPRDAGERPLVPVGSRYEESRLSQAETDKRVAAIRAAQGRGLVTGQTALGGSATPPTSGE